MTCLGVSCLHTSLASMRILGRGLKWHVLRLELTKVSKACMRLHLHACVIPSALSTPFPQGREVTQRLGETIAQGSQQSGGYTCRGLVSQVQGVGSSRGI